jgi:methionyl-tRNA formyltransferase
VPPRILKSVEYGGLNVHPSLLPKYICPHLQKPILISSHSYRGPAPLHHTILEGESHTGITLQTLDEKSFDHGTILAQTPQDGLLEIPDPFNCTHQNLLDLVTPKAAEMLVQGIRDKVFVPPLQDVGWYHPERLLHAPKITSEHRKINWKHWKPSKIHRHHRALGRLWCNIYIDHTTTKRMIFEDIEMVVKSNVFEGWLAREKSKWSRHWRKMQQIAAGRKEVKIGNTDMEVLEQSGNDIDVRFLVYATAEGERTPLMYFVDGDAIIISNLSEDKSCIRVRKITLEGERKKVARTVVEPIKDHQLWILEMSPSYRFTLIPRETSIPIRKLTSRPRATRRTNTTGKTLALVENRVIGVPLKVIRSDSDVSGVQRDANPGLRRPSPSCWLEKDQRASKPLENSASNMGGPRRSPSSRPPSSAPIASPSTAPKATTGGPIIRKVRPNQQTKWLYINFRPRTT